MEDVKVKLKGLSSLDIKNLLSKGLKIYYSGYMLFYKYGFYRNNSVSTVKEKRVLHISVVVKKSIGNAVYRNRQRRRIKMVIYTIIPKFLMGYQFNNKWSFKKIVLISLKRANFSYNKLEVQIKTLFLKIIERHKLNV